MSSNSPGGNPPVTQRFDLDTEAYEAKMTAAEQRLAKFAANVEQVLKRVGGLSVGSSAGASIDELQSDLKQLNATANTVTESIGRKFDALGERIERAIQAGLANAADAANDFQRKLDERDSGSGVNQKETKESVASKARREQLLELERTSLQKQQEFDQAFERSQTRRAESSQRSTDIQKSNTESFNQLLERSKIATDDLAAAGEKSSDRQINANKRLGAAFSDIEKIQAKQTTDRAKSDQAIAVADAKLKKASEDRVIAEKRVADVEEQSIEARNSAQATLNSAINAETTARKEFNTALNQSATQSVAQARELERAINKLRNSIETLESANKRFNAAGKTTTLDQIGPVKSAEVDERTIAAKQRIADVQKTLDDDEKTRQQVRKQAQDLDAQNQQRITELQTRAAEAQRVFAQAGSAASNTQVASNKRVSESLEVITREQARQAEERIQTNSKLTRAQAQLNQETRNQAAAEKRLAEAEKTNSKDIITAKAGVEKAINRVIAARERLNRVQNQGQNQELQQARQINNIASALGTAVNSLDAANQKFETSTTGTATASKKLHDQMRALFGVATLLPQPLDRLTAGLAFFSGALDTAIGKTTVFIGVVAAVVAGVLKAAATLNRNLVELDAQAKGLGLTTEETRAFKAVLDQSSGSIENFSVGIKKIQQALTGVGPEARESRALLESVFAGTGFSIDGKSTVEILKQLAQRFEFLEKAGLGGAVAGELFGRSFDEVKGRLPELVRLLEEYEEKVKATGIASDGAIKTAKDFTKATEDLSIAWDRFLISIGATDAVTKAIELLRDGAEAAGNFFDKLSDVRVGIEQAPGLATRTSADTEKFFSNLSAQQRQQFIEELEAALVKELNRIDVSGFRVNRILRPEDEDAVRLRQIAGEDVTSENSFAVSGGDGTGSSGALFRQSNINPVVVLQVPGTNNKAAFDINSLLRAFNFTSATTERQFIGQTQTKQQRQETTGDFRSSEEKAVEEARKLLKIRQEKAKVISDSTERQRQINALREEEIALKEQEIDIVRKLLGEETKTLTQQSTFLNNSATALAIAREKAVKGDKESESSIQQLDQGAKAQQKLVDAALGRVTITRQRLNKLEAELKSIKGSSGKGRTEEQREEAQDFQLQLQQDLEDLRSRTPGTTDFDAALEIVSNNLKSRILKLKTIINDETRTGTNIDQGARGELLQLERQLNAVQADAGQRANRQAVEGFEESLREAREKAVQQLSDFEVSRREALIEFERSFRSGILDITDLASNRAGQAFQTVAQINESNLQQIQLIDDEIKRVKEFRDSNAITAEQAADQTNKLEKQKVQLRKQTVDADRKAQIEVAQIERETADIIIQNRERLRDVELEVQRRAIDRRLEQLRRAAAEVLSIQEDEINEGADAQIRVINQQQTNVLNQLNDLKQLKVQVASEVVDGIRKISEVQVVAPEDLLGATPQQILAVIERIKDAARGGTLIGKDGVVGTISPEQIAGLEKLLQLAEQIADTEQNRTNRLLDTQLNKRQAILATDRLRIEANSDLLNFERERLDILEREGLITKTQASEARNQQIGRQLTLNQEQIQTLIDEAKLIIGRRIALNELAGRPTNEAFVNEQFASPEVKALINQIAQLGREAELTAIALEINSSRLGRIRTNLQQLEETISGLPEPFNKLVGAVAGIRRVIDAIIGRRIQSRTPGQEITDAAKKHAELIIKSATEFRKIISGQGAPSETDITGGLDPEAEAQQRKELAQTKFGKVLDGIFGAVGGALSGIAAETLGGKIAGFGSAAGSIVGIFNPVVGQAITGITQTVGAIFDFVGGFTRKKVEKIVEDTEKNFDRINREFRNGTRTLGETIAGIQSEVVRARSRLSGGKVGKKGGQAALAQIEEAASQQLEELRRQAEDVQDNFIQQIRDLRLAPDVRSVQQQIREIRKQMQEFLNSFEDPTQAIAGLAKAQEFLSLSLKELKDNAVDQLDAVINREIDAQRAFERSRDAIINQGRATTGFEEAFDRLAQLFELEKRRAEEKANAIEEQEKIKQQIGLIDRAFDRGQRFLDNFAKSVDKLSDVVGRLGVGFGGTGGFEERGGFTRGRFVPFEERGGGTSLNMSFGNISINTSGTGGQTADQFVSDFTGRLRDRLLRPNPLSGLLPAGRPPQI